MRALLMSFLCAVFLVACSRPPAELELQADQRLEGATSWRVHRAGTARALRCVDGAVEALRSVAGRETADGDRQLAGRLRQAAYVRAVLGREVHWARATRGVQARAGRERIDALVDELEDVVGATTCA
jgi:hypothetical protein